MGRWSGPADPTVPYFPLPKGNATIEASLHYAELRPPPSLADWVACCWQSSGRTLTAFVHRVLPDGCTDLLLDARPASGPGAWVCIGAMTRAVAVDYAAAAQTDVFGLRLRPGGLRRLLGDLPQYELSDRSVDLDQLAGPVARALPAHQLAALRTLAERAAWLWPRLAQLDRGGFDPVVRSVITRLQVPAIAATSMPPVAVLARDLGLSERTLQRRFAADTGYSPVQFRRLLRFRRLLTLLPAYAATDPDWADLAVVSGFADQAHLVRDFSAFAGLSPGRWWSQQRATGLLDAGAMICV